MENIKGKVEQFESKVKVLKILKQHMTDNRLSARKTLTKKFIPQSTSNSQTGKKQVIDREENPESQSTILQKIDAGSPEKSQTCTEKHDFASIALSKLIKIPDQPWTKVSYKTHKSIGKNQFPLLQKNSRDDGFCFYEMWVSKKSETNLMLALNAVL